MSHFVTIVFGENIRDQLAPFIANGQEHAYFEDMEEEFLEEYNHSQGYSTFEEFMSECHGAEERDPDTHRYGYWYDPDIKFDSYVVGGRWGGYFKPVSGAEGFVGNYGLLNSVSSDGWLDSLRLGDIDIEGMRVENIRLANETYDIFERTLAGRKLPSWNTVCSLSESEREQARLEYYSDPVYMDLKNAGLDYYGDLTDTYGNNRDEYIQRQLNCMMIPHAIVIEGLWFSCSTDDMSATDRYTKFWELIKSLPPETRVTAVDCHI